MGGKGSPTWFINAVSQDTITGKLGLEVKLGLESSISAWGANVPSASLASAPHRG